MANNTEMFKARGWLVKFGVRDLENDVFDGGTDFFFPAKAVREVPVLYAHGKDSLLQLAMLGEGTVTKEDDGLWIEATLKVPPSLGASLKRLSRDRLIGWSSGSASHLSLKRRGTPNYIEKWALSEASITVRPAMPLKHSKALISHWSYEQEAMEITARWEQKRLEGILQSIRRQENNVAV